MGNALALPNNGLQVKLKCVLKMHMLLANNVFQVTLKLELKMHFL